MADAEGCGPEEAQDAVQRLRPMTALGKVGFLFIPTYWALFAGANFVLFASFLLALIVKLFLHPHHTKGLAPTIVFLTSGCLISGAILIYPFRFFRKLCIRKWGTGSVFPSGEELAAIRHRGEHPPAWKRILVVSFFCLLALGVTHALWVSHLRHLLGPWSIPAFFWLIAIMVAVDAFIPRPGRQWTGFAASGASGALAILGIAAIIHSGDYRNSDALVYTLLMAALSIACAVMSVREGKRKLRKS